MATNPASTDQAQPSRDQFLVKSDGHPSVFGQALLNEYLGCVLAQHFGIRTPHPAIIRLSQAFVDATGRSLAYQQAAQGRIKLKPGLGIGSKFIRDLGPVKQDHSISLPKDVNEAATIFAFDMLVQNPDRRDVKPNTGHTPAGFVAYDFELSFAFLYDILPSAEPWRIRDDIARNHLFFRGLKGKVVDWQPFIRDLLTLDESRLKAITVGLPPEWTSNLPRIQGHLVKVRDNAASFSNELIRSLI